MKMKESAEKLMLDKAVDYVVKDPRARLPKLLNKVEMLDRKHLYQRTYDNLHRSFADPEDNWNRFLCDLASQSDPGILKKLLFNIVPEAAKYLADREIESIAKTTVFNCRPDALCVSGATAGSATDPEVLRRAKSAAGDTVVLANTGCRVNTIENLLSIADGAVVGTTFKYDGKFENQTDVKRVREFMDKVKSFR